MLALLRPPERYEMAPFSAGNLPNGVAPRDQTGQHFDPPLPLSFYWVTSGGGASRPDCPVDARYWSLEVFGVRYRMVVSDTAALSSSGTPKLCLIHQRAPHHTDTCFFRTSSRSLCITQRQRQSIPQPARDSSENSIGASSIFRHSRSAENTTCFECVWWYVALWKRSFTSRVTTLTGTRSVLWKFRSWSATTPPRVLVPGPVPGSLASVLLRRFVHNSASIRTTRSDNSRRTAITARPYRACVCLPWCGDFHLSPRESSHVPALGELGIQSTRHRPACGTLWPVGLSAFSGLLTCDFCRFGRHRHLSLSAPEVQEQRSLTLLLSGRRSWDTALCARAYLAPAT